MHVYECFNMLKTFPIEGHVCKASVIRQLDWHRPICNWICNKDEDARGSLGLATAGGIFRGYNGALLGVIFSFSCKQSCS